MERGLISSQRDTQMRPIGTSMRPMGNLQSRMGTAKNDPNFQSIGLTTDIKFIDRPVTNHGMEGVNAKIKTNRTIQDKSYYLDLLRKKGKDITNEITKFKKNFETIQQNNNLFVTYEKRYEELTKEVRELEGQLADYNLAFDKQRAQTRPEEIRNMFEHIKIQNDRQKMQLDDIFIERKAQEEQIQQIESQLHELNQRAELMINDLDLEQRNEYEQLLNENKNLNNNINNQRIELDEINSKLMMAENRLRMDSHKLKGQLLKEQIVELDRKKEDLEVQLNEANLSFPEARDRLFARIKDDNSIITNNEKRVKEIRKNIDNYEKKIREMQDSTQNQKKSEDEKQKYEVLFQKDKEMTEFIDSYGSTRNKDVEQLQEIENKIVEYLEKTSQILAQTGNLPSKEEYKEIKKEFEFKQRNADQSEKTLNQLKEELKTRSLDVKKLEQAEERIHIEMKTLQEKVDKMNDEIRNKFDKVAQIKREHEAKKKQLSKDRDELKSYKVQIQEDLKKIKYDHDLKEKKWTMHEMLQIYEQAEKKMSQAENQVYNLKNFIITKSKDMDYDFIRDDCRGLVDELNKINIKNTN